MRLAALELRDTLKTYPDRKVSVLGGPLLAFRDIVQEIRTLLPSISPAQTAVLSGSNFKAFLAEADYLLSVCGEGSRATAFNELGMVRAASAGIGCKAPGRTWASRLSLSWGWRWSTERRRSWSLSSWAIHL